MKPVERTRISYNEKDILQRYYERSSNVRCVEKVFPLHVLLINLGNADSIADQSKPIPRVHHTVCCTRRYDPRFETCCSGVISPKRG